MLCIVSVANAQKVSSTISVNKDTKGNPDGTYTVVFTKPCYTGEDEFDFYLSYKGKRVSDYYHSTIRSCDKRTIEAVAWPDEVPKGNEKFVTVQLGKEPAKKDRRDDD